MARFLSFIGVSAMLATCVIGSAHALELPNNINPCRDAVFTDSRSFTVFLAGDNSGEATFAVSKPQSANVNLEKSYVLHSYESNFRGFASTHHVLCEVWEQEILIRAVSNAHGAGVDDGVSVLTRVGDQVRWEEGGPPNVDLSEHTYFSVWTPPRAGTAYTIVETAEPSDVREISVIDGRSVKGQPGYCISGDIRMYVEYDQTGYLTRKCRAETFVTVEYVMQPHAFKSKKSTDECDEILTVCAKLTEH